MLTLPNPSRVLIVVAVALAMAGTASAQTAPPPHVPPQKTIGAAKPEVVPSLFVLNSRGATLENGKLVLTGVSPNAIVFADRPVRSAGHDLTSRIVDDWASGSDNFAKDPPNATISAFQKEGGGVRDAVVVLKNRSSRAGLSHTMSMYLRATSRARTARQLYLSTSSAVRSLPCRFAGVARRTAWRGAYYAGAAAVGAAAVGAAAYGAYGPRPACGYYPYPPCH